MKIPSRTRSQQCDDRIASPAIPGKYSIPEHGTIPTPSFDLVARHGGEYLLEAPECGGG